MNLVRVLAVGEVVEAIVIDVAGGGEIGEDSVEVRLVRTVNGVIAINVLTRLEEEAWLSRGLSYEDEYQNQNEKSF